jgi:hypothetical protein
MRIGPEIIAGAGLKPGERMTMWLGDHEDAGRCYLVKDSSGNKLLGGGKKGDRSCYLTVTLADEDTVRAMPARHQRADGSASYAVPEPHVDPSTHQIVWTVPAEPTA